MKRSICPLLTVLAALFLSASPCHASWSFQVGTGSAYSFDSDLDIEQDGEEDISLTAEYETRAWETMAPYYNLRIGKWKDGRAWEFESLHHKLHLANPPAEVQEFTISHGYNINTLNYAVERKGFIYRGGLGVVITHPETEVREKRHEDEGGVNGFHLSGVAAQLGAERRFFLSRSFFLSFEVKATAAYADIPVADGSATVPNYALHGIVGVGWFSGGDSSPREE